MNRDPVRQRLGWVDALRGLAVVGMIWVHCANTFLEQRLQQTAAYAWASYFHGLIAPTFFWLAGWVRGVAVRRDGSVRALLPAVKRLGLIFVLGHLLHIPWTEWMRGDFSVGSWRIFLQADVLQCLALSGLLLLAIERFGRFAWVVALTLLVVVLWLTDVLKEVQTGWLVVDAYLNRQQGSLFPLFPWVGFALAGFLFAKWRPEPRALFLAGVVVVVVIWSFMGEYTTASFFVERLAWVLAFAGASWMVELHLGTSAWPQWLLLVGRRSLSAYVTHMLLIYVVPLGGYGPLSALLGMNQSLRSVMGWFILILLLSLSLLMLVERRKSRLDTAAARALQ